jgi:hypothetical protein
MKLPKIVLGLVCWVVTGCSFATSESFEVNNITITLSNLDCVVRVSGQKLLPALGPKCHFIKDGASGKVKSKYYADIQSHVVLLLGNSVSNEAVFPLSKTRNDCGSKLQALIISNRVQFSSKTLSDTFTCAGVGVDEKEFYMLSHPRP